MKIYPTVGIQSPSILLPNKNIDLTKWAVVACDQYTSQPSYWRKVEDFVGNAPSTYHLTLPEAYLGSEKELNHANQIFPAMKKYFDQDIFHEINDFLLVKRTFDGKTRIGLIAALDLEQYDFSNNSQSLIRSTEGTIIDRLPPRIAIRKEAIIEIPHILVLIDDPEFTVIMPINKAVTTSDKVYDFDLMQKSGNISAHRISSKEEKKRIIAALERLKSHEQQAQKYGVALGAPPLLYAMGDGNHSLATAKSIWEESKHKLPRDHPSRFALVEIVNLHNAGIEFEAIHRLIESKGFDLKSSCDSYFAGKISIENVDSFETLTSKVDSTNRDLQVFGLFNATDYSLITFNAPKHTLTVGNVQPWIDQMARENTIGKIDYIHGSEIIHQLGIEKGFIGIYLPAMPKDSLFKSVINDGPLPRKTFSMGEAHQKRFYLECRKIK